MCFIFLFSEKKYWCKSFEITVWQESRTFYYYFFHHKMMFKNRFVFINLQLVEHYIKNIEGTYSDCLNLRTIWKRESTGICFFENSIRSISQIKLLSFGTRPVCESEFSLYFIFESMFSWKKTLKIDSIFS